jgi:hypothetical protein
MKKKEITGIGLIALIGYEKYLKLSKESNKEETRHE